MKDAEQYRGYAEDCFRMAAKASSATDKKALLEMAKAWEARADAAEKKKVKD